MKNMAILDADNVVLNIVTVSDDELETESKKIYTNENPAYVGGDYLEGYFYPTKPYPSWSRDKGFWIPPIPLPNDGQKYQWNEETQSWNLIN